MTDLDFTEQERIWLAGVDRAVTRTLPDGCDDCGLSEPACHATWHTLDRPCCVWCSHD